MASAFADKLDDGCRVGMANFCLSHRCVKCPVPPVHWRFSPYHSACDNNGEYPRAPVHNSQRPIQGKIVTLLISLSGALHDGILEGRSSSGADSFRAAFFRVNPDARSHSIIFGIFLVLQLEYKSFFFGTDSEPIGNQCRINRLNAARHKRKFAARGRTWPRVKTSEDGRGGITTNCNKS